MNAERLWAVWCHLVGHQPQAKFTATICARCRIVLERETSTEKET